MGLLPMEEWDRVFLLWSPTLEGPLADSLYRTSSRSDGKPVTQAACLDHPHPTSWVSWVLTLSGEQLLLPHLLLLLFPLKSVPGRLLEQEDVRVYFRIALFGELWAARGCSWELILVQPHSCTVMDMCWGDTGIAVGAPGSQKWKGILREFWAHLGSRRVRSTQT